MNFGNVPRALLSIAVAFISYGGRQVTASVSGWSGCDEARPQEKETNVVVVWKDGSHAGYILTDLSAEDISVRNARGSAFQIRRRAIERVHCAPSTQANSFPKLDESLGRRVLVELIDGTKYRGTLVATNSDGIRVRAAREPHDFPLARNKRKTPYVELSFFDIHRVKRFDNDSPWEGFAVGAGIGVSLEVLTHDDGPSGMGAHAMIAGTVLGGIGLLLDYAIKKSTVVYETVP